MPNITCPRCGAPLTIEWLETSHTGKYNTQSSCTCGYSGFEHWLCGSFGEVKR